MTATTIDPQLEVTPGEQFIPRPMLPVGTTTTKRGVNLGCGTVCMPCEQPLHQRNLPDDLYTDTTIAWDNVDRNAGEGVNRVVDLFTYPWQLESNAYDVAIVSHLVEHIPHHIVWNGYDWGPFTVKNLSGPAIELIIHFGQVIPAHPLYQDGWFAWFSELHRIMKPGGQVHVLVPYAWSHAGVSDPTHTRYLTPATFNYFNNATDESPSFHYQMHQRWSVNLDKVVYSAHEMAVKELDSRRQMVEAYCDFMTMGTIKVVEIDTNSLMHTLAHHQINAMVDFYIMMECVK